MENQENKTIIQYRRTFHHAIERVFEAFLDPAQVKVWFGPKEFSIGKVKLTPEPGGNIDIEMITPNGAVLWAKGIYREIIPLEKISYTFSYVPDGPGLGESLVSFYFTAKGNETEVALVHEIYKTINPEGRTKGWEDGFDKMDLLLQKNNK
jgi:uncharacterized protein YndB with AHSA1/START domain